MLRVADIYTIIKHLANTMCARMYEIISVFPLPWSLIGNPNRDLVRLILAHVGEIRHVEKRAIDVDVQFTQHTPPTHRPLLQATC